MSIEIVRPDPVPMEAESIFTVQSDLMFEQAGIPASYTEEIPFDLLLYDWDITGSVEAKDSILLYIDNNKYTWNFIPAGQKVEISLTLVAPAEPGIYTISGKLEQASEVKTSIFAMTIASALATCGDAVCSNSESIASCPADCTPAPEEPLGQEEDNGDAAPANGNPGSANSGDATGDITGAGTQTVATTTTVTTTTSSGAAPETLDVFARKKSSDGGKLFMYYGVGIALLGAVGAGVYYQIKNRGAGKGMPRSKPHAGFSMKLFKKESKEDKEMSSAREKLELDKVESKYGSKMITKDAYVQQMSSELPSFTDRTNPIEIPRLALEMREMPALQMSIPPMPRQQGMLRPEPRLQARPLSTPISAGQMQPQPPRNEKAAAAGSDLRPFDPKRPLFPKSKSIEEARAKAAQPAAAPAPKKRDVSEDDIDSALDSLMKR